MFIYTHLSPYSEFKKIILNGFFRRGHNISDRVYVLNACDSGSIHDTKWLIH